MAEINEKEYWVVIPFTTKQSAVQCLGETMYDGFVVARNTGEWKAIENQRIRG